MKCHACSQDNADSALFCTACRRPLLAPSAPRTRLEPLAPVAAMASASAGVASGHAADDAAQRNRFAPPNAAPARHASGSDSDVLTEEEAWAAVIGDSNTDYYLTRFERLSRGESAPWHWPALFVTWYWMLYRKLWVPALIYFFAPSIVMGVFSALLPRMAGAILLIWWLAIFIGPAVLANRWYYAHCERKIRDVRARGGSKEQMLARLEAAGGTSNIIVIVVAIFGLIAAIGILAAVSLPAYQAYTVKAKVSEAVQVGNEVASAVGRQYEQTGALPAAADLDRLSADAARRSRFVSGIEIDPSSGALTVHVAATPSIAGTFRLLPNADASRHVTWSCTTEDLVKYVPKSCR
jgi:Tfp pilus assembly protein PilE